MLTVIPSSPVRSKRAALPVPHTMRGPLTVLMLARADRSGMLPSSKMTCRHPQVMQEGQKPCRASARRHKPLMAFKALRLSCTLRLAPCSALQFGVGQLLTCSAMQASQSKLRRGCCPACTPAVPPADAYIKRLITSHALCLADT
jgi:hypothetical protein